MDLSILNTQIPKIRISIRIIAAIIAIVGIVFYFTMSSKKVPEIEAQTSAMVAQNASLKATEEKLSVLHADMQHYLSETQRLYDETEETLKEFPTFMYLEDKILYADTLLKTDLKGYNLSQFAYGQSNYVMNVNYGSGADGQSKQMELYSVYLNVRYVDLTYKQIKELLDYGLNSPQRFVINNISMGYNEQTGYISGEFSFSTYFIPGQTEPYVFPESVVADLGDSNRIDDLFGARQTPIVVEPGN